MEPVLYFDVGSPYSFLAVERAERVFGEMPELRPVLLGGLFKLGGRASWGVGDPALREAGMLEVESRATAYDLPAIRWPRPWPGDYLIATRDAAPGGGLGGRAAPRPRVRLRRRAPALPGRARSHAGRRVRRRRRGGRAGRHRGAAGRRAAGGQGRAAPGHRAGVRARGGGRAHRRGGRRAVLGRRPPGGGGYAATARRHGVRQRSALRIARVEGERLSV